MKSTFICLLPLEAGHIFKTKKLDLSIYTVRVGTHLQKMILFGGRDYTFCADCNAPLAFYVLLNFPTKQNPTTVIVWEWKGGTSEYLIIINNY
jgi:hypothetical protein